MSGTPVVIEDRAAAIAYAIARAGPHDTILVAGKGHEKTQVIGERTILFSDYASAQANLEARADPGDAS